MYILFSSPNSCHRHVTVARYRDVCYRSYPSTDQSNICVPLWVSENLSNQEKATLISIPHIITYLLLIQRSAIEIVDDNCLFTTRTVRIRCFDKWNLRKIQVVIFKAGDAANVIVETTFDRLSRIHHNVRSRSRRSRGPNGPCVVRKSSMMAL